MGSPYGTRELVAVTAIPNADWKYGFFTNADSTDRTVLGHIAALASGVYIPGLVLGANAPKPARATRKRASGSQSSFVDITKIDNARAAGWKINRRPRVRYPGKSKFGEVYYVTVAPTDDQGNPSGPQVKYAWFARNSMLQKVTDADRTALGWSKTTGSENDLIFGARYPRPPLVEFELIPTSGASSVITTFADPSKLNSLPSGWKQASTSAFI